MSHNCHIIGLLWCSDTGAGHGGCCAQCTVGWGSSARRNIQTVGLLIGALHRRLAASMINTCVVSYLSESQGMVSYMSESRGMIFGLGIYLELGCTARTSFFSRSGHLDKVTCDASLTWVGSLVGSIS